jgi:orotate phosphoribosyltransferase
MSEDDAVAHRAEEARRVLDGSNAIITGDHFVYVTGEHGDGWIDKDAIFPDTQKVSGLAALLAEALAGREFDIVCGPATGGLIVAQWTAHHLGLPSVFAEHAKETGYQPAKASPGPLRPPFVLRRGYDERVRNKRVLVVDDVVNTGESVTETVQAVRDAGGVPVAVAALCTRGNAGPADVGSDDFVYLVEIEIPSWPAADCRLCREGVPVNTRYAHGADFLAAQRAAGP